MKTIQTTLKFLNAVVAKKNDKAPFVDKSGLVIMPDALWAKGEIVSYYREKELTPEQLNQTFHKSWKKIEESSRFELFLHQILHYASTYGTDFSGPTYIPLEELDIPEKQIKVFVVQALSAQEIKERLLKLLQSGVAMSQEDIVEIIECLEHFGHKFSQKDNIRNKEAIIILADKYNLYPENPVEFLRYCVFKSTGKSLLIKNKETYKVIKNSEFDPTYHFRIFGEEKLAEIFNRFKPIFLSYKTKCPQVVNRISKLSKEFHKPLRQSDLNFVTRKEVGNISGATTFAFLRAWSVINEAKSGHEGRVFFIRNGKSFVDDSEVIYDDYILEYNERKIIKELKSRLKEKLGQSIYIPENVDYALPVSTKMFVGDIPIGTRFYGNNISVGVYWENSGGARDIDLSGITEYGKVGWNADYNQNSELMYSGDMTNASQGAVEYLYSDGQKFNPTIAMTNIYSGSDNAKYSIIIGEGPKSKDKDYMMNPNKVMAHIKTQSVQKQSVLGVVYDKDGRQTFSIINVGAGSARVSGYNELANVAKKVFIQKWSNCLTLREALSMLSFAFEEKENADIDLSLDLVTKEKFVDLFASDK